jgi:hypothetical protein
MKNRNARMTTYEYGGAGPYNDLRISSPKASISYL